MKRSRSCCWQSFLAPQLEGIRGDIRALDAKVDKVEAKIDAVDMKLEAKIDALDAKIGPARDVGRDQSCIKINGFIYLSAYRQIRAQRLSLIMCQWNLIPEIVEIHAGGDRYRAVGFEFQVLNGTELSFTTLAFVE